MGKFTHLKPLLSNPGFTRLLSSNVGNEIKMEDILDKELKRSKIEVKKCPKPRDFYLMLRNRDAKKMKKRRMEEVDYFLNLNKKAADLNENGSLDSLVRLVSLSSKKELLRKYQDNKFEFVQRARNICRKAEMEESRVKLHRILKQQNKLKKEKLLDAKKIQSKASALQIPIIYEFPEIKKTKSEEDPKKLTKKKKLGKMSHATLRKFSAKKFANNLKKPIHSAHASKRNFEDIPDEIESTSFQYSRPNNVDYKKQIEDKLAVISKKIKYLESFRSRHSAKCNFCHVNPNPKPTKILRKKPEFTISKESPKLEDKPRKQFLKNIGPILGFANLMYQKELIKQSAPTKFTAHANAILKEKQKLNKDLFAKIFEKDAVSLVNPNQPKSIPSPFSLNKYKDLFARDILELNKPLDILDGVRVKPKNSKHQKINFLVPSFSAGKVLNVDNVRYSTVDSQSYYRNPDKEIKPGTQLKNETARIFHVVEEEVLSQVSEDLSVKEDDLVDLKDSTARVYEIKQLLPQQERWTRDMNKCWHKTDKHIQPSYEIFTTSKPDQEEIDFSTEEHEYNIKDVLLLNKKQEEFNQAMREPEVWKNPSHDSKCSTIESPVFEEYFEGLKKEQIVEATTTNKSIKEEDLENSILSEDLTKLIKEQMEYLSRSNLEIESCKCRQQIIQTNDSMMASDQDNLETPKSDERPEVIKPEDGWSSQEKPLSKMEPDDDWLADNSCVKKPPNQYDLKSDINSVITLEAVRSLTLQPKSPKISTLGKDQIFASTMEKVEKTLSESTELDSNRPLDQESTGDRDNLELLAMDSAPSKDNTWKIPTIEYSTIDRLEKNDNYQEIYPFGFLKSASKSQNWLKDVKLQNTAAKTFSDEIEVTDNKFTLTRTEEGAKDKKLTSGFIEAKTRKCKCGKDLGHESGKDLELEPLVYGIFLQLFLIGEAVAKHSLEMKKDKKLVESIKEDTDLASRIYAASQSVVGLNSIAQKLENAVALIQEMTPPKSLSESCVISKDGISEISSKNLDEDAIEHLCRDVMSYVKKNQDSTLSTSAGSEVPTCLNETVVCEDTQSGASLMSLNSKSTDAPPMLSNQNVDIIEETCKIAKDLVKETQEILKISPISITEANKFLEILENLKEENKIEEAAKKEEDPDWLFKDVQSMKTAKSLPNLTIDELWDNHKEKAISEVNQSKKTMMGTFEDSKSLSDHLTVTVDKIINNSVDKTVNNNAEKPVDTIVDNSVENSDKAVCDLFRRDSESIAKNRTSDENKYNSTDYQQLSWDYQFPELSSYFKRSDVDRDGSELRQTKSEQLLEGMNQTDNESTKKEEDIENVAKTTTENVEEEKHNHSTDYPLNIIRVFGNFFKGECKVCKKLSLMLEKDTDEEGINQILEEIKRNQTQCSTSSKSACQLHEKKRKCSTSCYTARIYQPGKTGSRKGDSGKEVKVIMDRFKWRNNDDMIIGSITKFVDVTKKRYCTLIDDFGDDEKKRELIKKNSCPDCLTVNPGKVQNQKPYVLKGSRIEAKEELIPDDNKSMKYRIFDKNDEQSQITKESLINKLKYQSCKEKLQEEKNLISSTKDVSEIKPKIKKVENVRKIHNIGHALNFKYVPSVDLSQKNVRSDYLLRKRRVVSEHSTKSNINLLTKKVPKSYLLNNMQLKDYGNFQMVENYSKHEDSTPKYKIDLKNNENNLELNLTLEKKPDITKVLAKEKKKPPQIISKIYNTSHIFCEEILQTKNCPITIECRKNLDVLFDDSVKAEIFKPKVEGKSRNSIFNVEELIDKTEKKLAEAKIPSTIFNVEELTDDNDTKLVEGKTGNTFFNVEELIDQNENVDELLEITLKNVEDNLLKPQIILPETPDIVLPTVFSISGPSFKNIKQQIDVEVKELENLLVEPQKVPNIYLDGLTKIYENKKCCEEATSMQTLKKSKR